MSHTNKAEVCFNVDIASIIIEYSSNKLILAQVNIAFYKAFKLTVIPKPYQLQKIIDDKKYMDHYFFNKKFETCIGNYFKYPKTTKLPDEDYLINYVETMNPKRYIIENIFYKVCEHGYKKFVRDYIGKVHPHAYFNKALRDAVVSGHVDVLNILLSDKRVIRCEKNNKYLQIH